jgi:hypothetical protein
MNQPDDAYTIVIFRGSTAKPLRLSFSRPFVRRAMIAGAVLVVMQALLLAQYVVQTSKVWELQEIRQELVTAREQTNDFSTALEDLKRRVLAMKEVNEKLRVMLGIESLKPEDYLNGQGGEEGPLTGESQANQPQAVETTSEPFSESQNLEPLDGGRLWERELAGRLQKKIGWLQREAITQERSLEELSEVVKERWVRWGSTPSVWPVKGWLTSGFGPRISPFTGQLAMHDGLDIGAPPNAPIQAPAGGLVVAAGFDPRMGNVVAIDHGYGIETQYGHMAKVLAKKGQRVKRGDVLGLVGNTGLSTGPHLHYMIKINSRPVNPQRYILN